jgi:Contact-dependent growth inhibition CdiA C-terminal domain
LARKNFFRLSPDTDFQNDSIGAAIHAAYGSPEYVPKKWWKLSKGEPLFEIKSIIFDALREIWKGNSGQILNAGLFSATYKALLDGVEQGYGQVKYGMPDFEFVHQLQNSAKYFAARKTALQVVQLTALVGDAENGTRRPWGEYKKLARGVVGNYNQTWLKTEYDATVRSARAARQWKDFEKTKHLFPNLIYRKTVSATPDTEHLKYVGITLPIEHQFWDYHTPPLRWNCKCSLKNTDAEPTSIPSDIDITDPVEPAFQNNPGRTGELFNIPLTTYTQKTQNIADSTLEHELRTRILPKLDFNINLYQGKNGGSLSIHPAIVPDEFNVNVRGGFVLAKKGYKIDLLPTKFQEGIKDPDLLIDGKVADFKRTTTASGFNSAIKRGQKQGCEVVVVTVNSAEMSREVLTEAIGASLSNKEKHSGIKKIIIHYQEDDQIVELNRSQLVYREEIYKLLK